MHEIDAKYTQKATQKAVNPARVANAAHEAEAEDKAKQLNLLLKKRHAQLKKLKELQALATATAEFDVPLTGADAKTLRVGSSLSPEQPKE